jgi:hypothetical protein
MITLKNTINTIAKELEDINNVDKIIENSLEICYINENNISDYEEILYNNDVLQERIIELEEEKEELKGDKENLLYDLDDLNYEEDKLYVEEKTEEIEEEIEEIIEKIDDIDYELNSCLIQLLDEDEEERLKIIIRNYYNDGDLIDYILLTFGGPDIRIDMVEGIIIGREYGKKYMRLIPDESEDFIKDMLLNY